MEMGIEFSAYLRYVVALVFVMALIWLAAYVLRRTMGHRLGWKRPGQGKLTIDEVLVLDSRHKLVLVQHQEQEHLLLLGHNHALLVGAKQVGQTSQAPGPDPSEYPRLGRQQ